MKKQFHTVKIGKLKRKLPLFQATPNIKIALFNILGDTQIVIEATKELIKKINKKDLNIEVIVTPEAKSIPLAYEMSRQMKIPYIVARKICKPYMKNSIKSEVNSITTGKTQILWIDGKDLSILKNKNIALVDDVISTGSTLKGLHKLMKKAQAKVISEIAVFTEGDKEKWNHVISLGHLPIFN